MVLKLPFTTRFPSVTKAEVQLGLFILNEIVYLLLKATKETENYKALWLRPRKESPPA